VLESVPQDLVETDADTLAKRLRALQATRYASRRQIQPCGSAKDNDIRGSPE